jgi:hypothetical protein
VTGQKDKGFYILKSADNVSDGTGFGEALLDETCASWE